MELNENWKLTTQNNAYLWEGNQISKQNRYPCYCLPHYLSMYTVHNVMYVMYLYKKELLYLHIQILTEKEALSSKVHSFLWRN